MSADSPVRRASPCYVPETKVIVTEQCDGLKPDAPVLVGFVAVFFFFAAAVVVSIFAVLDVLSVVVIVVVV